ncbi:MAG: hypothetical protein V7645_3092 [Actinomycetota bacterium]
MKHVPVGSLSQLERFAGEPFSLRVLALLRKDPRSNHSPTHLWLEVILGCDVRRDPGVLIRFLVPALRE